jgi:tetratricopeptide (TPR) repeat protein
MSLRELSTAVLTLLLAPSLGRGLASAAPISSTGLPGAVASPLDLPEQVRRAIAAFQRGDRDGALRWLQRAHEETPDLAPAEIMLANMYFSNDQFVQGREILEQASVQYPEDPEPHLIFGDLAWRERRLSDAQLQYEHGKQLTADFTGSAKRRAQLEVRALAGLANVAEARGEFQAAHELFTALLQLEPQHAQARYRSGVVLFALSRPDEALAEFREATKLLEGAPPAPLMLAELYGRAGDAEQLHHWIEQAIGEAPQDIRPLLAMARWQLELRNDPQAAAEACDRAARLDSESSELQLLRGMIAWSRGDLAEAEKVLETVVFRQPENVTASCYLAAVLAEHDDPDRRRRALELVQLVAATHPGTGDTAAAMGWVAYQLGNLEQAEQQLQHAAAAAGAGRDTNYYLARTLYRRGQIAMAQQALEQALAAEGLFIHLTEARTWQQQLGEPGN